MKTFEKKRGGPAASHVLKDKWNMENMRCRAIERNKPLTGIVTMLAKVCPGRNCQESGTDKLSQCGPG